jgi:hypothetical protein
MDVEAGGIGLQYLDNLLWKSLWTCCKTDDDDDDDDGDDITFSLHFVKFFCSRWIKNSISYAVWTAFVIDLLVEFLIPTHINKDYNSIFIFCIIMLYFNRLKRQDGTYYCRSKVVIDYFDKSRFSDRELTVFTDSFILHTDWDPRPHCKYHLPITYMTFESCQPLIPCYKTCA